MTSPRHSNRAAEVYRLLFLVFLVQRLQLPVLAQQTPFGCNLLDDISQCSPKEWQADRVCEEVRQEDSCTDCFDCDPCRTYMNSCEDCVSNGCHWCPGDALCSSRIITQDAWDQWQNAAQIGTVLQPSCVMESDWKTGTCSGNSTTAVNGDNNVNIFSDPLMDSMNWLYDMILVKSVWQSGIFGQGVHIRVTDIGGVDATHAEFSSRFDEAHSCEGYLPSEEDQLPEGISQHGTAVASLALGGADNGQCAVGIAPSATLSACKFPTVGNPMTYGEIMITHLDAIDISVNSWSLNSCVGRTEVRHRQRDLQQSTGCPFASDVPNSPCQACGSFFLIAGDDYSQLPPDCRISISSYCRSRFEFDVEACTVYLPLYAECVYDAVLQPVERAALEIGVQEGRDGKGVIFVMSSGNHHMNGDSTNGQKWVQTRYTISVGAVNKNGLHPPYSNTGASLFVSGPGGDTRHLSNNIVAKNGGGCHDIGAGTSFSAPVVAGVVALMLEVNPELTWRDVQGILASTSQKIDNDDDSWAANAAGVQHSYKYGFGLVNAQDAVAAAETWTPWAPEQFLTAESDASLNLQIPATSQTVQSGLTISAASAGDNFEVESVVVWLNIDHPSRGDLTVVLTSPQKSESILHQGPRPENTHHPDGSYWELMTVRAWGEPPAGTWILSIQDERAGNLQDGCVDMYWNYVLNSSPVVPSGALVTCNSVMRTGACANGQLVNQGIAGLLNADTGLAPGEACCVCGGGMPPSEEAQLTDWKLIVYGRSAVEVEADAENEETGDGDDVDDSATTNGSSDSSTTNGDIEGSTSSVKGKENVFCFLTMLYISMYSMW